MKTVYKWVQMIEIGEFKNGELKAFMVQNRKESTNIGTVQWYQPWREFCFFPYDNMVFSPVCMRDIATFCLEATSLREGGET